MGIFRLLVVVVAVGVASGCVTSHPQTAREFRQAVPGAFMAKTESYIVEIPFDKVAQNFKKMAPKCLDVTIRSESRTRTSYQVIVTDYNPTVVVGKDQVELHVQQHHKQGVMKVTEEPEGGYYLMVFDAFRQGGKTRIEYYGPSMGHDTMIKAIKGWASGKNMGCPDLTK